MSKFNNRTSAWIKPDGTFIEVDDEGHEEYARSHEGCDDEALMKKGWLRLSGYTVNYIHIRINKGRKLTRRQDKTLLKYMTANKLVYKRSIEWLSYYGEMALVLADLPT